MSFIVNSLPGAGRRYEASATFPDAKPALQWALELEKRGMRSVRIRDTVAEVTYDQKGLRDEIERLQHAG